MVRAVVRPPAIVAAPANFGAAVTGDAGTNHPATTGCLALCDRGIHATFVAAENASHPATSGCLVPCDRGIHANSGAAVTGYACTNHPAAAGIHGAWTMAAPVALGDRPIRRAAVIGSGPNGLAAAIRLGQAGIRVDVFEAQTVPGGGARTLPLTETGFLHDFGSAVHPLAVGSPYFHTLPLERYGLEWIHSPHVVAHPLDGGAVAILDRDLDRPHPSLRADGVRWSRWMRPFAEDWAALAPEVLGPIRWIPRRPFLMARFGLSAFPPANFTARRLFREPAARALYAGIAAHSFLAFHEGLSSAVAALLASAAHAVGWPIPRGGAQAITAALVAHLETLGGTLTVNQTVRSIDELRDYDLVIADVTPRQVAALAGSQVPEMNLARAARYRYGPGVFKLDYALSAPVPWQAQECAHSATVHVGGTLEEIAAAEAAVRSGAPPERPFVLFAQSSLFDPSRAPVGRHTGWAYCHVPAGSTFDMTERIEAQIERFAPGFRDCIVARHVLGPAALETMDANLIGGDINGGSYDLGQFLLRSSARAYRTPVRGFYVGSSSTPPAGGVHGMCGFHAAECALRDGR